MNDPAREDPALERWLREPVPTQPPAALDHRVLAAGRALTAARVQNTADESGRSMARPAPRVWMRRLSAAAAGVVMLAAAGWVATLLRPDLFRAERTLAAAGGGFFTVGPDARYELATPAARLDLRTGFCRAHAAQVPLTVAFPGGLLHVEQGHGKVDITHDKEVIMQRLERKNRKWTKGAVVVTLALAAGWATIEIQGSSEHPLPVGEERLLLVQPDANSPGTLQVEDLGPPGLAGDPAADAPPVVDPAAVDPAAAPTPDEEVALFRGRVVDAVTGLPVAGARVGWVARWVPEGVSGATLRHPRSTIFVQSPANAKIGEHTPQIPLVPGPLTELRVTATSDATGAYQLPHDARPGEFLLATADGYQPWFAGSVPQGDVPQGDVAQGDVAQGDAEFVSRLSPQRILHGQVVAEIGGPLIADAISMSVQVSYDLPDLPGWTCSVAALIGDDYTFDARLGSIDKARVKVTSPGYQEMELEVALGPGVTQVTFALEDHPHLRGRVTDPQGQPIAGASLLVKSRKRGLFRRAEGHASATTNADGLYVANIHGNHIELGIQHDAYAPREFTEVPADAPFDIVLEPTTHGSLRGVVLDERQQPLAGASVRAMRDGIGYIRSHRTTTDARGEFLLDELLPGKYRVTARPSVEGATELDQGWGPEATGAVHVGTEREGVVIEGGKETAGLELVVPPGAMIRGTFRDADGAPGAGERISLYRPDLLGGDHALVAMVITDAQGSFAFHGLPAGSYAVGLDRIETFQLVRVGARDTTEVDLGGATFTLHGRVRRGATPVATAPIAIGRFTDTGIDARTGVTDADGSYRFQGLARGRHLIHVRDPATHTALFTIVEVGPDPAPLALEWPTATVTVTTASAPVAPGTQWVLVLAELGGTPLADRVPAAYLRVAACATHDGTTFRFEGIGPGRYQVVEGVETAEPRVKGTLDVGRQDVRLAVE